MSSFFVRTHRRKTHLSSLNPKDSEADESGFRESVPFFAGVDSACFPDELLPKGSKQIQVVFGKPQCGIGSRGHVVDAVGVLRRIGGRMPHGYVCAECAGKYSKEIFEVLPFDWHPEVRRVLIGQTSPVPA